MNTQTKRLMDKLEETCKSLKQENHHNAAALLEMAKNSLIKKEELIGLKDIKIGDVVRLENSVDMEFSDMTVKNITKDSVVFFRPYVHTGSLNYLGLTCYIGIEEFKLPIDANHRLKLISRKTIIRSVPPT